MADNGDFPKSFTEFSDKNISYDSKKGFEPATQPTLVDRQDL